MRLRDELILRKESGGGQSLPQSTTSRHGASRGSTARCTILKRDTLLIPDLAGAFFRYPLIGAEVRARSLWRNHSGRY
jgi:hypothetical protein